MRYNDVRDGTDVVEDVLRKYQAAWRQKGLVMDDGLFPDWWMVKQDHILPARDLSFTAWAGAFMNSWNSDLVKPLYARQSQGFITNVDGQVRLQPMLVANAYRKAATSHASTTASGTASDPKALCDAVDEAKLYLSNPDNPRSPFPYTTPTWGYVVQWLSELGKRQELEGLLDYADQRLNPTWENGGLYYPRNDRPFDVSMEWLHMDPFSGNAAIGYARLNVEDGQRQMWERPWSKESVQAQPWVDGLDFGKVAVTRGVWDSAASALIVTVKGWDFDNAPAEVAVAPVAKNLPAGRYTVYVRASVACEVDVDDGGSIAAREELVKSGEEVDFVFVAV